MFKKYVLCIDDLVDGLTMYKLYPVENIVCNHNGTYIELLDDYGLYNMFFANRFIFVTDKLINNIKNFQLIEGDLINEDK